MIEKYLKKKRWNIMIKLKDNVKLEDLIFDLIKNDLVEKVEK